MDHAEHLTGSSPSISKDTASMVSQSAQSGSDDILGSDVSLSKYSSVVHNSCRPVFFVCLALRLRFSLVEMSSSAA